MKNTRSDAGDIVTFILRDHVPLKHHIQTLKDSDLDRAQKESALQEFVPLLINHAKAEEKTLYLQMREVQDLRVESFEGKTEHEMAEQLVREINATPDDDEWCAKVKVLAESVEHHIEEEEAEMLNHVEAIFDAPKRRELGLAYEQLKRELDTLMNPRPTHVRARQQLHLS